MHGGFIVINLCKVVGNPGSRGSTFLLEVIIPSCEKWNPFLLGFYARLCSRPRTLEFPLHFRLC